MKHILKAIAMMCLPLLGNAQSAIYNNGAFIHISNGAIVQANGELTNNAGSSLSNDGELTITGNVTNSQVMSNAGSGTLKLTGTSTQNISGVSPLLVNHITFNNAGTSLVNSIKIYGESNFINGIIVASDTNKPVCYANTGSLSITNPPTKFSHVNGYVVKEGIGSFEYPVGNGTRYQKVGVNLSANSSGMRVKYYGTDAGTGNFGTSGTSGTPLINYNNLEYWEIIPQTTATGNVTIYWDNFNNTSTPLYGLSRVAHKVGSSWLNEGTFAAGNASSGYVVSNPISSWDKFTLGRIDQVGLPINIQLNLSLYLEGYYNGSNSMRPVLLNQGQGADPTITDTITVELHPEISPNNVATTAQAILHTNGNAQCLFTVNPGNYYIVIKHRNSVETWSANPIEFTGALVAYNYSAASNTAFGNNQIEVEPGIFAIHSGDINEDENVDLLDASFIENDINIFQYGYYSTDINGDGNVDLLDAPIVENNINSFVFSNHP